MQELGATRSLKELSTMRVTGCQNHRVPVMCELKHFLNLPSSVIIYLFKKGIPGQLETCLCKNSIYHSDFNLVIYFALEMVSYKKYIFIVPVWRSGVNLSC